MSEIRPVLVALLLGSLFAIAVISFGIRIADINQANQSIADDPRIKSYADSLNSSLADASSDAQSSQSALDESPTTLSSGLIILDAIGGIWKTLIAVPITIWNLTFGLLVSRVFGDNSFVIALSVIGTIIGITIILAVWKLVSTGEGG